MVNAPELEPEAVVVRASRISFAAIGAGDASPRAPAHRVNPFALRAAALDGGGGTCVAHRAARPGFDELHQEPLVIDAATEFLAAAPARSRLRRPALERDF